VSIVPDKDSPTSRTVGCTDHALYKHASYARPRRASLVCDRTRHDVAAGRSRCARGSAPSAALGL